MVKIDPSLIGVLQALMGKGGVKKDGGGAKQGGKASNWKNSLVQKVKDFQKTSPNNKQAWYTFCDSKDVGKYDPTFYEPRDLQTFLDGAQLLSMFSGMTGGSSGGGGKSKLVDQVKQFQKRSPENKEAWYSFCATQPVGKYDPALHEPNALKTFLSSVGASGGFAGSSNFSAEKGPLIAAVKGFQKMSAENKQVWYSFCDEQGVGKYDPAYYEPDVLQTFLDMNGISAPSVPISSFSAGSSFSSEKGGLIAKVKQFQKSSEENKQAWWSYADSQPVGKRDPALHDPVALQTFLDSVGVF